MSATQSSTQSSAQSARSTRDVYAINWDSEFSMGKFVWDDNCSHNAIPNFAGYKKISGNGPELIKVGPGTQLYGCFEGGAGRNFYGSHDLTITIL